MAAMRRRRLTLAVQGTGASAATGNDHRLTVSEPGSGSRLFYLDNLKWVLIAAVIVSHAATAYGAVGAWLFEEPTLSPVVKTVFSALIDVGGLFALGTFMLVAGLLTPPALARKGLGKFVRDRLLRLGLPVVAAVVLVTPVMVWMIVAVTGYRLTLAAYVRYQLRWLDPGPMWFAAVLLFFTLCYAGWRAVRSAGKPDCAPLQMRHVLVAAALIAVLSFAVRLAFPIGSQQPLEVQFWEWPRLAVLFAFGVMAWQRGWLAARTPAPIRRACWVASAVAIAALLGALAATGFAVGPYSGGWHWQAALTAGVEGVLSVGASLALVDLFRQVGSWHGRFARSLSRHSYSAYFLQLPVLVSLELGLWRFAWPGDVKLALTAPVGLAICFGLPWAFRNALTAASRRRGTAGPPPGEQAELDRPQAA